MTTTSLPKRLTPKQRLDRARSVAENFETELLYVRHVDPGRRESDAPLTDLNFDGLLLTRLAAAFDDFDFDFDFNADNEPQHYHFKVHLLAAALSTLGEDEDDLEQAVEDAKEVIRERRRDAEHDELEEAGGRSASGRLITRMIGHEKFRGL